MTRSLSHLALVVFLLAFWPSVARAQSQAPAAGEPEGRSAAPASEGGSAAGRFFRDVGRDYKDFFRVETAAWYVAGLGAANVVHIWDEHIAEELGEVSPQTRQALEGGDNYGNLTWQVPMAVGWWAAGKALDSSKGIEVGRDLLRAQISATSWNYLIKFAVDRTRPNGDPRSFPSGHATATFATAMVLQDHYGWKVGVPSFVAASYTAVSRIIDNKHWASDVTMGAFVGIASARTVTLHLRQQKVALAPYAVPGGWAVGLVGID
jgi:hypothetical protein